MPKPLFQQGPEFRKFCLNLRSEVPDYEHARNYYRRHFSQRRVDVTNEEHQSYVWGHGKDIRGQVFQNIVGEVATRVGKRAEARILARTDFAMLRPYPTKQTDYGFSLPLVNGGTELDVVLKTDDELWVLEAKFAKGGEPISSGRVTALSRISEYNGAKISYAVVTRTDAYSWHAGRIMDFNLKKGTEIFATYINMNIVEFGKFMETCEKEPV